MKQLRWARTLTQAEFGALLEKPLTTRQSSAKQVGKRLRQQTLSKYESGEVKPPAPLRARIATILATQHGVLWPDLPAT